LLSQLADNIGFASMHMKMPVDATEKSTAAPIASDCLWQVGNLLRGSPQAGAGLQQFATLLDAKDAGHLLTRQCDLELYMETCATD
jgi:hypothetical protein